MIKAEARVTPNETGERTISVSVTMNGMGEEMIEEASSILADIAAGALYNGEMDEAKHETYSEWALREIFAQAKKKLAHSRAFVRKVWAEAHGERAN